VAESPALLKDPDGLDPSSGWGGFPRGTTTSETLGFEPGCGCGLEPVPCLVLDPFAGSGTTGLVADRHGRDFIGIELNPVYAALAERRLKDDSPLFAEVAVDVSAREPYPSPGSETGRPEAVTQLDLTGTDGGMV
jgi:hypothetical protein